MAILTLNAYPATLDGHFVSIEITRRLDSRQVEVKTAADCTAAFEKYATDVGPTFGRDVSVSAYIRDGHGRKPTGYKLLKLERFIEAPKVDAGLLAGLPQSKAVMAMMGAS